MERSVSKPLLSSQPAYQSPFWRPSVDVYRTDDAWLLKFDLAGVEEKNLRVSVQGRRVVVSGERRDWTVTQGCRAYQMEIAYSQFERAIELPEVLDASSCRFEYRDGMLLVTVQSPADRGG